MKRHGIPLILAATLSLGLAVPVLAVAPTNDTYAGRTAIGIRFSESLDTSEATTDVDDGQFSMQCTTPTDASVWYELTLASSATIGVDVSASDYSAGVAVATGSPGSFSVVGCGSGAAAFEAVGGETYTILVFDDQTDGGGNGGVLNIVVDETTSLVAAIDITVNPTGTFTRSGLATVSGTVVCDAGAEFGFVDVRLRQRAGSGFIDGFGSTVFGVPEPPSCDGTVQPWTVIVSGNGSYRGGKATASAVAAACNALWGCGTDNEERSIMLRAGPRAGL